MVPTARTLCICVLALGAALSCPSVSAAAGTLVVNSASDPGTGVCDATECTLREAITMVNGLSGTTTIQFGITSGPALISVTGSPLPTLTVPANLDGTTQSGYAGTPVVRIHGGAGGLSQTADGLTFSGCDLDGATCTVIGLSITGFPDDGLVMQSGTGLALSNSYIGVQPNGAQGANLDDGILLQGHAVIGGSTAAARNVISGNSGDGIDASAAGSQGVQIRGNYIGVGPNGSASMGNIESGVELGAQVSDVGAPVAGGAAGGACDDACNVIAANVGGGVQINAGASGAEVVGNHIGVNATGAGWAPNSNFGVRVGAANVIVGGTGATARNVISGSNIGHGVQATATGDGLRVKGNYIGLNAAGTAKPTDAFSVSGVRLEPGADNADIGLDDADNASDNGTGPDLGERNVISGNNEQGIHIVGASGADIRGNYIGTQASGTGAVANGTGIVASDATGLDVGDAVATGAAAGTAPGNLIAGNAGDGIWFTSAVAGAAWSPDVMGNVIGLDVAGSALPNGDDGVVVDNGPEATLGEFSAALLNVISGNTGDGVEVGSLSKAFLLRNYVGPGMDGIADRGNGANGVNLAGTGSSVGYPGGAPTPNLISGNTLAGVRLAGEGNHDVYRAKIGLTATDAALANGTDGIRAESPSNVVGSIFGASNTIAGNEGAGVRIVGAQASGNVLRSNAIGLTGSTDVANRGGGVVIVDAANNTVGGDFTGAGNIIGGNRALIGPDVAGVLVTGSTASGNAVVGNRIGYTGVASVPNDRGVVVNDAPGTLIGGEIAGAEADSQNCDGACNVISGNFSLNVFVTGVSPGTRIAGNYIGTNASGDGAVTTPGHGVDVGADDVTVGGAGTTAGVDRNVISGNGGDGILALPSADRLRVEGNYIGTKWNGEGPALGNGGSGIHLEGAGALVGGTTEAARNVIGGHDGSVVAHGVRVVGPTATGNRVEGNYVGMDENGAPIPNVTGIGVVNGPTGTQIGGTSDAAANRIANSTGAGVRIYGSASLRNTVGVNSIGLNGGLGIDLGDSNSGLDGITPNDALDADLGPNELQNFPVVTGAWSTGSLLQLVGTLGSEPNGTYTLRFFHNAQPGATAELYVGSTTVNAGSGGDGSFNLTLSPAALPAGAGHITATATDAEGNTSEISAARQVEERPAVRLSAPSYSAAEPDGTAAVTVTRSSGQGTSSVVLSTADGTATAGSDYTATSETVTFAADETAKSVQIPVANDGDVEGDETVALSLAAPTDAVVASPSTGTLTITSEDVVVVDPGPADPGPADPGPTDPGPSGTNARPDSKIGKLGRAIRADRLRRFRGSASDPDDNLEKVQIALVKLGGTARAARATCRVLRKNGRLEKVRPVKGKCPRRFLDARGTAKWTFKLKRRLPRGRYVVYSRAVDALGLREKSFSKRDGNRRAFRLTKPA